MRSTPLPNSVDLLVVGGGINGTGIARDAAGRGLSVLLVEREDLASHTSAASTKLIHGGLRYLEYGEFRLVREALFERERLWAMAPHIIWPLHFVLPQAGSPRPAWMVRLGLWLYDHLGGRHLLPATRKVHLAQDPLGNGLTPQANDTAFVYSDCWVEDSRLVVLNAISAREKGAHIHTRTALSAAAREGDLWRATITPQGAPPMQIRARAIVNAAGPWVTDLLSCIEDAPADRAMRLVKGSHIIVPRLYQGEHAFLLQNPDRRVIFAIPYEGEFTLIGTTDEAWQGAPGKAAISPHEVDYLLDVVARNFTKPVTKADIVWSYAGIRPLYDDKSANASAVTRDYVLDLDTGPNGAPLLSVFGGKITTYRKLAEHAMDQLAPHLAPTGPAWTAGATLPGGDFPATGFEALFARLAVDYPALPPALLRRWARAYGTATRALIGPAHDVAGLGQDFGGGLYEAEVRYLVEVEWARCAQDILTRRSKLLLHVPDTTQATLDAWFGENSPT